MRTDVYADECGWWWASCECGWVNGPFVAASDARDDADEHECAE